jgi:hypothetical protein
MRSSLRLMAMNTVAATRVGANVTHQKIIGKTSPPVIDRSPQHAHPPQPTAADHEGIANESIPGRMSLAVSLAVALLTPGIQRSLQRPRITIGGAPHHAHASAAATHATSRAHTQPSSCTPRPHAMRSRRARCPPHCHRGHILTASQGATSVLMGHPVASSMGQRVPYWRWRICRP